MLIRSWMVIACAIALSGCATVEDVVPVAYTAQGGAQTGAGIKVVTEVVDARDMDRGRISTKINGFGQQLAAIRSDREVTAIVKDAFDAELKGRGYAVENGGPKATISVKRFYSSFKIGAFSGDANADVQFTASVVLGNGSVLYRRDFAVTGTEANILLANGTNAAASLSDGMKKAFAAIFSDEKFVAALHGQGTPVAAADTHALPNS
jgi:uncharacterized lipoprotein YajG